MPPLPSRTRSEVPSASSVVVDSGSSPTTIVALHDVTCISRLWPALAAAPVRPVCTASVPWSGPSLYVPVLIATCV